MYARASGTAWIAATERWTEATLIKNYSRSRFEPDVMVGRQDGFSGWRADHPNAIVFEKDGTLLVFEKWIALVGWNEPAADCLKRSRSRCAVR
jgi:hypothetical protein